MGHHLVGKCAEITDTSGKIAGKKQKKHHENLWDWETVEEFHGDVIFSGKTGRFMKQNISKWGFDIDVISVGIILRQPWGYINGFSPILRNQIVEAKRQRHEMRRAAGDVEKDSDKGEKNIEKPRIESQKVGPEEEDQPRPLAMNSLSRKKDHCLVGQ